MGLSKLQIEQENRSQRCSTWLWNSCSPTWLSNCNPTTCMQQLRNYLEFVVDSLRISPFISDVGLALNLQINQVLLDEVKWGQQWGLDIEYIKVLSVKAMKGHIWNWIWNFSRNNYRIFILMLWVLIVLIKY